MLSGEKQVEDEDWIAYGSMVRDLDDYHVLDLDAFVWLLLSSRPWRRPERNPPRKQQGLVDAR